MPGLVVLPRALGGGGRDILSEHSRWVLFHPHTAECPKEGVQLSLKESELPWDPKTLLLGNLSSWTERLSIQGRDSLF